MFEFAVDVSDLDRAFNVAGEFFENDVIPIAHPIVTRIVKKNMNAGTDPVTGGKWEVYKPSYAETREKLGKQTEHVDFQVTGSLIEHIGWFEDLRMVTVDPLSYNESGAKPVPHATIAEGLSYGIPKNNVVPRPFLTAGQETADEIVKEVTEAFDRLQ